MITVNSPKCPQNHLCPMVRACPKNAISQIGYGAPIVDASKCIECMACVNRCPHAVFERK